MQTSSTLKMHQESRLWLSELDFILDEVQYFQNCLVKIIHQDFEEKYQAEISSFQKDFIHEIAFTDELKYHIRLRRHYLSYFKRNRLHGGYVIMPNHEMLRQKMGEFILAHLELKRNFRVFQKKCRQTQPAA